ncbi:MAG: uroporphyrinogen decarboxylase family protein [Desulforhopalus sp.]
MTMAAIEKEQIGQNFKRLLAGEDLDRPLVWLYGAVPSFAVQNVGYEPVSAYNDPEKAFDAQIKTISMYGSDGIPRIAVGGASDVTWAFGGAVKWPAGEYDMAPVASRYPVNSEKEALAVELPADIASSGPMPLYLSMAKLQHQNNLPVFPFITSPIEGARSICGVELLLRWMVKKPELAHQMLRIATDYSVAVIKHFAGMFPPEEQIIYLAAPTASNQLISPKLFETFVLPYQHELHTETLAAGIKHIYCHICGEQNKNLPMWQHIPMGDPGVVSFGHEVDLLDAIAYFGNKCIIAGNIEPALIHLGPAREVYRLSCEALEKGQNGSRGFILMPGCGIPPNTPPYNLFMLKKALADLLSTRPHSTFNGS